MLNPTWNMCVPKIPHCKASIEDQPQGLVSNFNPPEPDEPF